MIRCVYNSSLSFAFLLGYACRISHPLTPHTHSLASIWDTSQLPWGTASGTCVTPSCSSCRHSSLAACRRSSKRHRGPSKHSSSSKSSRLDRSRGSRSLLSLEQQARAALQHPAARHGLPRAATALLQTAAAAAVGWVKQAAALHSSAVPQAPHRKLLQLKAHARPTVLLQKRQLLLGLAEPARLLLRLLLAAVAVVVV